MHISFIYFSVLLRLYYVFYKTDIILVILYLEYYRNIDILKCMMKNNDNYYISLFILRDQYWKLTKNVE